MILASRSPRRSDLLSTIGVRFTVVAADVDERWRSGESPVDYVGRVAALKADTVARSVGTGDDSPAVLAADTTVDVDGRVLGKPSGAAEAREMLWSLSGRTHRVHTAVVCRVGDVVAAETVSCEVTFVELSAELLDWYLATGEWADKAGAYGVQGAAGVFVTRVDGSPSAVIGLPVATTARLLAGFGCFPDGCFPDGGFPGSG